MQENRHSTSCPYALPPEWSPTRQFLREPTGSRTHFPTNAERIVDHGEALCFCASSGTHLQRSWCKAPAHSRSPHVPCPGCPRAFCCSRRSSLTFPLSMRSVFAQLQAQRVSMACRCSLPSTPRVIHMRVRAQNFLPVRMFAFYNLH